MLVEGRRLVIDRVHHHRPDRHLLSRWAHPLQRIEQQQRAESAPLDAPVHGQPHDPARGDPEPRTGPLGHLARATARQISLATSL